MMEEEAEERARAREEAEAQRAAERAAELERERASVLERLRIEAIEEYRRAHDEIQRAQREQLQREVEEARLKIAEETAQRRAALEREREETQQRLRAEAEAEYQKHLETLRRLDDERQAEMERARKEAGPSPASRRCRSLAHSRPSQPSSSNASAMTPCARSMATPANASPRATRTGRAQSPRGRTCRLTSRPSSGYNKPSTRFSETLYPAVEAVVALPLPLIITVSTRIRA